MMPPKFPNGASLYSGAWMLLLFASAIGASAYLCDPVSEPIPVFACAFFHASAWIAALVAWRRNRLLLQGWGGFRQFVIAVMLGCALLTLRGDYLRGQPSPRALRCFALRHAIGHGDVAAVQWLLAHDPDPDYAPGYDESGQAADPLRPLEQAVFDNDVPIATALLDHGASLATTEHHEPLLVIAASRGNVAMLRALTEHGLNLRGTPESSRALLVAVDQEHVDAVAFLLEHGVDPNRTDLSGCSEGTDCGGESALHAARRHSNGTIKRLLAQYGAAE